MKKYSLLIMLFLGLVFLLAGCGSSGAPSGSNGVTLPYWPGNDPATPVDLYVAGTYKDGADTYACYWKYSSGSTTRYTLELDARATAIYVSGGKVYTAGYYNLTTPHACYWVDTVRHDLENTANSKAMDIKVAGTKIYILGWFMNSTIRQTRLWSEPIGGGISGASNFGTGDDYFYLAATGTGVDVYTAGSVGTYGLRYAYYRKNLENIQSCSHGTNDWLKPTGLYVTDTGAVYVAGCDIESDPQEYYWVNGACTVLNGHGQTKSIAANDTDVYTLGGFDTEERGWIAVLWKNQKEYALWGNNHSCGASAIQVIGSDTYIAGYIYNNGLYNACFWINGARYDLADGDDTCAIFAQPTN
ncbi:MAG TPA: hypothetical protein VHY08_27175 [Bacillota bacterium]|nr:hypothetical protein [Bacillota bacterium]